MSFAVVRCISDAGMVKLVRQSATRCSDALKIRLAPRLFGPEAANGRLGRLAYDLGATEVGGPLSEAEQALLQEAQEAPPTSPAELRQMRAALLAGGDPL